MADAPARARPDTTARMVAKVTAERKPSSRLPPTAWARCMTTMLPPPSSLPPASPPSKNRGCWLTITIDARPSRKMTLKK